MIKPRPKPRAFRYNPRFVPTSADREAVRRWAVDGSSVQQIARRLGVRKGTVLHYFADDIDDATADARMTVISQLRRAAAAGSVRAMIAIDKQLTAARDRGG